VEVPRSFDLPQFMFCHFPCVDFGGDLFGRWPVGIRFEIGLENVSRATALHEFIFNGSGDCILVSQEWQSDDRLPERFTSLFSTPGVFLNTLPPDLQSVDVSPFDETPHRLSWVRLPLNVINAPQMFQAIANSDHGLIPAIAGSVYVIDDRAKLIMHMYDDRGLDVIAANASTLAALYKRFSDWVLKTKPEN
jgi:hypothetical protein